MALDLAWLWNRGLGRFGNGTWARTEANSPFKKCTLFECQGIYHESANRGYYFQVPNWKRDRHFTWSSEPREGQGLRKHK